MEKESDVKIEIYNGAISKNFMHLYAKSCESKKPMKVGELLNSIDKSTNKEGQLIRPFMPTNCRVVVCSAKEMVLGFLCWAVEPAFQQAEIFLCEIDQNFKGKGIEELVLLTGIRDIVSTNRNRANIVSLSSDTEDNAFYEKMGAHIVSIKDLNHPLKELDHTDKSVVYRFRDLNAVLERFGHILTSFEEYGANAELRESLHLN